MEKCNPSSPFFFCSLLHRNLYCFCVPDPSRLDFFEPCGRFFVPLPLSCALHRFLWDSRCYAISCCGRDGFSQTICKTCPYPQKHAKKPGLLRPIFPLFSSASLLGHQHGVRFHEYAQMDFHLDDIAGRASSCPCDGTRRSRAISILRPTHSFLHGHYFYSSG